MVKPNFNKIADGIVRTLNKKGIKAYVWCRAKTGTVYIRFEDPRMCSIRIGDHDGREYLRYKYNVRSDIKEFRMEQDNNVTRLYYPINSIGLLIHHLQKRKEFISKWERPNKYQYGIPKHLKR